MSITNRLTSLKIQLCLAIRTGNFSLCQCLRYINPLNAELNSICYLLALLGAHHFLHVSKIRVKSLTAHLLRSLVRIPPGGMDIGLL